jgi:hypothetical protein
MRNNAHYLYNLLKKGRGSMDASLGNQPCPFLLKNSASHSTSSKRGVSDGGGHSSSSHSGKVGKVGRAANFSEIFIGSGFCDG